MPGNEKKVLEFLVKLKEQEKTLKYIGKIISIKVPNQNQLIELNHENIDNFFSDDANKKADAFINNIGCSIKQAGGNFPYNRLQRKNLNIFFKKFFSQSLVLKIISNIDKKINEYHKGKILRNFKFIDVMSEKNFKKVLKYLMTEGSPNIGATQFKAKYIIEAKKTISKIEDIEVMNFDDYFKKNKTKLTFAIRAHWIGQNSKSESKRAATILKTIENKKWCFDDVRGTPRSGWDPKISVKDRKTTYTLSIEQK